MENKNYIKELNYGNVTVVENKDYQWAVIDNQGNFVVPFGKYGWIDGFDSGLARVRTHKKSGKAGNTTGMILDLDTDNPIVIEGQENVQKFFDSDRLVHPEKYAKWGIINEKGEEVLPLIYDNIWNFLGKNRYSTKVEKDGYTSDIDFKSLNPSLPNKTQDHSQRFDNEDYYPYDEPGWGSYDEYGGYNGYDDYTIDSAFDGDPEATWNID